MSAEGPGAIKNASRLFGYGSRDEPESRPRAARQKSGNAVANSGRCPRQFTIDRARPVLSAVDSGRDGNLDIA